METKLQGWLTSLGLRGMDLPSDLVGVGVGRGVGWVVIVQGVTIDQVCSHWRDLWQQDTSL